MASRTEARHREIARRYRAKSRHRFSMAALRIAELRRLFAHRYNGTLPDDDAGRADAVIMAHHLARRPGDQRRRIVSWCETWAPWLQGDTLDQLIADVIDKPRRWKADTLAERLNLTDVERRRLRITTIGASDRSKADRMADRKARKREAERARRRARGAKPRKQYESTSAAATKPWLELGISRRTWYRNRATANDGTSAWTP
jgi:hypothetical protein